MKDILTRFWSKVNKDCPGGCWLWTAGKGALGYGQFNPGHSGWSQYPHRISWELAHGPIPEDMEIDHGPVCHNRACVNPDHLRLASRSENNQNRVKNTNNRSGLKGVSWNRAAHKREARVGIAGKSVYLGLYESKEDAHVSYCDAAKRSHGNFFNLGNAQPA